MGRWARADLVLDGDELGFVEKGFTVGVFIWVGLINVRF